VSTDLTTLADSLLDKARQASSGRAAETIEGGSGHALRQTVLGMAGGADLSEHESPGEATLQVLRGRVTLSADTGETESLEQGGLAPIPATRHSLHADTDAVVLLTVVKPIA